ncbi:MAG: DUF1513 domain-containing protein [Hyphomicrobiaceae bacterium]|nr:DUF1513 domain-containing protein [Hyphomicrobiaceae bacterium]
MALNRRMVLTGVASALLLPSFLAQTSRAGEEIGRGEALFVSSARRGDGSYCVVIVSASGRVVRELALNDRGHDVAVSPDGALAVAFARRPGTFAVAFDVRGVRPAVVFETPPARHFYGHGVFSADGRLLYATENDFERDGRGVLGVYDVAGGFHRIGELPSHGLGPHDLLLLDDGRTICVANGGIETHPDAGRSELNLDTMRPSLVFLDSVTGDVVAEHVLPQELNRLSLRHLCADGSGKVWFGGQWQGAVASSPELIGSAGRDRPISLVEGGETLGAGLKGYVGSVSASNDGRIIAASAPKAGAVVFIDPATGRVLGQKRLRDVCGIAPASTTEMALSSGDGVLMVGAPPSSDAMHSEVPGLAFDNHLRRLRA